VILLRDAGATSWRRPPVARNSLTPRTVAFHKYSMMAELGIKSNAELIQFAIGRHSSSM